MICYKVHSGKVGVSVNRYTGFILLQTEVGGDIDDDGPFQQTRIAMDVEETEILIEKLQKQIELLKNKP